MQQKVVPTGPFGIGALMHVIHISDDLGALNAWYEDVLGAVIIANVDEYDYLPEYKRYASVVLVSDLCFETIAPEFPIDTTTPIGRFYERFGAHHHSMGYVCDDIHGLA